MNTEQHIRNAYVTALSRGKITDLDDQIMVICGEVYEAWKDIDGVPYEYHTEIADIFIATFTYCGMIERYNVDMNGYFIHNPRMMFKLILKYILDRDLSSALGTLYKYCEYNNIDIERFIEGKIEYNRVRKDWN